MKMKVHQTLVWLNLLSLGTKGLTEPTIGIQSGLCHGRGLARTASQQHSLTTLIRHFVSIKPASTLFSCIVYTDLSSQPPPCSMPAGPVRQVILPAARPAGCFPCRTGPAGRYSQFSGAPPHTTSVARLPGRNSGQKAQKGPQKKKFLAEFWLILPKTGRKGAAENIQKKFLIFSCDNCDKFDF